MFVKIIDTKLSNFFTLHLLFLAKIWYKFGFYYQRCYLCKVLNNLERSLLPKHIDIIMYGTILVVDDNPGILTALIYCLEGTFENVITINNPDDIMSKLSQNNVDIVLLDMNFSLGLNTGQEGIFWLNAITRRHPDLPIVLLTAYADVQLAVRALKNGAADFMVKPWDNDELIRKLKDVIDKRAEISTLDEVETEQIRLALDRCHNNLSLAAEMLGISRQTLYNKMKKIGL